MASSTFGNSSGSATVVTSSPLSGDGSAGTPITAGATVALTSGTLAQFAATTSAQLAGIISDETGSGAAVFANTPTFVSPVLGAATGTSVNLSGDVRGATFHVGATAGADASVVIPGVATLTFSKGILTASV